MKVKILAFVGILAMIVALLPGSVLAAPKPIDYRPMDVGARIREMPATADMVEKMSKADIAAGEAAADAVANSSTTDCITDAKYFLILNDYAGSYQLSTFYLMGQGALSQIWVQANLSWPAGDPRPTPVITCDQVQYMIGEFDGNIYPQETAFFGLPDLHDGSLAYLPGLLGLPADYYYDTAGRQVVLVSNVRDENFYDSTYPIYIAGFYSSAFETYFDRNTMTIDAYDWLNRTGPSGTRPYLYEGVFAHEYQHLLHDDYDPAEENWINEGLADWAMDLCGYGASLGHLDDLIEMPENSLVVWGDQGDLEILADYGIAYLYQEYMYEHYGQTFIQNEFHNSQQGIASVNAVLTTMGAGETFANTYHDFAAAMYTQGAFTHNQLKTFQIDVGHPGMPNPEAFATPGAPPWGGDYYLLWGYERIANFKFNGYQFNPLAWTSDGSVLWGGSGDLIDNWAIFETTGGGTLTFDTSYLIEPGWDFGFVQVSTDGGSTWTSLSNGYTTSAHDPNAHPNIIVNLPGLTGDSGGWLTMSYDLSAYAGMDILIGLRYMTDWSYTDPGWYVDNIYVDDTLISDGSSTAGLMSLNEVLGVSNEYTVLLIGDRVRNGKHQYEVMTVMSGGYASDWTSIRKMFDNYRQLVMVVIYDAPQGVASYADYNFEFDHRGGIHLK